MNKQSISFKANEQKLTKTGGIEHYASNIVAYIEATFDLGTNWNGYDSVRAVWSNDYLTDISTVLDSNGKCIVPTEVLTDTGNVTVNLVGSIADGDTLTDRLTTYPCKAVIVDADAKVEGEETENVTPSQFEQFVEIVHDEVEQVTGMTAEAETLPAGSSATASYSDGVLSFGIPRGDKGEQGEQGETGHTGAPAGFGNVTASVDNTVGTPSVVVNTSGPDTAKEFDFQFHNLKGDKGDTGATGATGNGIASTVLNPDYTLTITFTDGTHYTTPSIRGAKGDTGNTGATGNGIQSTVLNADYTLTITFTDGTSYTTPSIRGEQGPAGPVSDVTVNGTSVVDQNGVAVITMPELVKTVQGNPIVIDDAFGEVKNLDVELLPIQDLHGYSKPWEGGAGTNKFNWDRTAGTPDPTTTSASPRVMDTEHYYVGLTRNNYYIPSQITSYTINEGEIKLTSQSGGYGIGFPIPVSAETQYTISYNEIQNGKISFGFYDSSWNFLNHIDGVSNPQTITTPTGTAYLLALVCPRTIGTETQVKDIQVQTGSTATTYSPYSNICPITGHDSVTVTDTDGDSQSQSKTVTLPHTVYGGKPNITTGNGKETWVYQVLNGTEDWRAQGSGALFMPYLDMTPYGMKHPQTGLCDTYATVQSTNPDDGHGVRFGSATYNVLYIVGSAVDEGITTAAEWKTRLAQSPIAVCYQLETPTDLQTTPTDITLYNGDNVISSDGDMELSYVQDMAIVIRKIENQL